MCECSKMIIAYIKEKLELSLELHHLKMELLRKDFEIEQLSQIKLGGTNNGKQTSQSN